MESQGRITTVEEVVQLTINDLNAIRVPAGLIEEIGIPIIRSIRNLQNCQIAWARDAAKQNAEKSKESTNSSSDNEEPEITLKLEECEDMNDES